MTELSPQMVELLVKMNTPKPQTVPQCRDDPLIAEIKEMKEYLDAGTIQGQWPASAVMSFRLIGIMMGNGPGDPNEANNLIRANNLLNKWKAESRRRYAAGYHANPLGEPILRNSKIL